MVYRFLLLMLVPLLACETDRAQQPVRLTPSERSGFAFAYDAAWNNVLLFGGSDSTNMRLGDTWTWTPQGWRRHDVTGPTPRSDAQVAYDAGRQRIVLFGGHTPDDLSSETWTWDGDTWVLRDTTTTPPRLRLVDV